MILLPPLKPKQNSSGSFAYRSEKSAGSLSKLWEGQELSVFTVGFIIIGIKELISLTNTPLSVALLFHGHTVQVVPASRSRSQS